MIRCVLRCFATSQSLFMPQPIFASVSQDASFTVSLFWQPLFSPTTALSTKAGGWQHHCYQVAALLSFERRRLRSARAWLLQPPTP